MDFRGSEEIVIDYLVETKQTYIYKDLLNKIIKLLESISNESRLFFIDR